MKSALSSFFKKREQRQCSSSNGTNDFKEEKKSKYKLKSK